MLTKHGSDLLYTGGVPDEGGEDHVDVLLNTKQQVAFVLLWDGGQVDWHTREVDALLAAEKSTILNGTVYKVASYE